jgi:hypothetical protein
MCTDDMATAHLHQPDPQVLHDFEPRVVFDLEPVDSVTVTMLMDNVTDAFMPDQGPAHRPPLPIFHGGRRPATTMEGGDVPEVPLADGGFSVLVDVAKNGARHRILFDAGTTPDGVVENMRRLEVDPSGIETIICSHGHFDHTAGLDGLIRRLGRVSLPVLIHPHFWRQRRLSIPGRDPRNQARFRRIGDLLQRGTAPHLPTCRTGRPGMAVVHPDWWYPGALPERARVGPCADHGQRKGAASGRVGGCSVAFQPRRVFHRGRSG